MTRSIEPAAFRSGDVLLHHSEKQWISRAIRFFDRSNYNHTSFLLNPATSVEASLDGIVESSLPERLDEHDAYVDVYRLAEMPPTFRPVTDRAQHYLEQGARFSKEQLVFLAFLVTTRRIPLAAHVAFAVRRILDGATAVLNELIDGGKEPMICSELVFRCFNEALPDDEDAYTLRVNVPPSVSGFTPAPLTLMEPLDGSRIHAESLVAAVLQHRAARGWEPAPPAASHRPAFSVQDSSQITEELEDTMERYLAAVEANREGASELSLEALAESPDVREALDRFVRTTAIAVRGGDPISTASVSERRTDLPSDYALFAETMADFVTPRDLKECEDLTYVGRYTP